MITLTGAEAEVLDQAIRNSQPIYDSDGIQPVVEGIIAARLTALAAEIESDAASAWGGPEAWLTSGDKVAAVVACWIRAEVTA